MLGEERWRKGRSVKIVDGTCLSMPDTAANQADWPQSSVQSKLAVFRRKIPRGWAGKPAELSQMRLLPGLDTQRLDRHTLLLHRNTGAEREDTGAPKRATGGGSGATLPALGRTGDEKAGTLAVSRRTGLANLATLPRQQKRPERERKTWAQVRRRRRGRFGVRRQVAAFAPRETCLALPKAADMSAHSKGRFVTRGAPKNGAGEEKEENTD